MRIDVLTLFPEMFPCYLQASILQRAQEAGLLRLNVHNIRDHARGRHRVTDEPPYGGGGGMVLKPGPIFRAVESLTDPGALPEGGVAAERDAEPPAPHEKPSIILLSPQGRLFSQSVAQELARQKWLILICGRYEGVDERVRQNLVTDEISIGDYVLTGGELAAMTVIDAVARLIPGVLGAEDAAAVDSHASGLLEGPHYTRPATFRGWSVPDVLRSGHAANIARWRRRESLRRTWRRRPDLLLQAELTEEERYFLATLAEETAAKKGGGKG